MTKWLVLAAGVFLFFNGMMARTYGYANSSVYCFNMDYIKFVGCFRNSASPQFVVWATTLVGAALILWSFFRGRRST
ncbi:hypothetical protein [Bosea sp. (in: a-proteobacteria)]|uniref:hypothetical protein n=1 Tax=Bosea sp. (in: a-proteobacteria) TaxID=1871050 RepID=UPI002FC910FA